MAKRKISVKTTPGINAPVEHVLRLEDLLGRMQAALPKSALAPDPLRQAAAEFEARLRAVRAAAPAPRPKAPKAPKKKP